MSTGYPDWQEAHRLLTEAESCNPGPWGDHSRVAAMCAERIAQATGLNAEKAYVLGLLHDIGRKFGVYHIPHVYNGYHYMMELGYGDVARVCLTHSFSTPDFRTYIGKFDLEEEKLLEELCGNLKLFQARSRLVILVTREEQKVNAPKVLRENMNPFLYRRMVIITETEVKQGYSLLQKYSI